MTTTVNVHSSTDIAATASAAANTNPYNADTTFAAASVEAAVVLRHRRHRHHRRHHHLVVVYSRGKNRRGFPTIATSH